MASRMRPCACDTAARLWSGPCFAVPHSSWSHRFPPLAPPRRAPPCSRTSSVLSVSLTAPSRSSSATTSGLPVAAPRTASQGGDGALPVPVQEAYVHARVPDDAGWYGSSRYRIRLCCLLLPRRHWHPGLHCFRRSQPGLHTPLSMLRVTPRGATRMTRGRCGSLPLHRSGLHHLLLPVSWRTVAQSPTPSDHCVRFASAVADDFAAPPSRRCATAFPGPA